MKKHHMLACFTAAGLALSLTACSGASDAGSPASTDDCTQSVPDSALIKSKTLTYATNATLPPMQYMDNGKVTGMRVELANKLAEGLCLTPEPVNVPFDAQIPGLSGKRWDVINTGMFYTPERAETIALVPYEIQGVSISVPAGNPEGIKSEDDLAGRPIAVEAPGYEFDTLNLISEDLVAANKEPLDIKTFPTNAEAFQALASGQVEGTAIIESVTSYYQEDGRFETAFSGLRKAPLAFGFAKENTELANAVAKELTSLRDSGWLPELFDKYGVTGYSGDIKLSTGSLQID